MSKKRAYAGQDITVFFDAGRCIHAAECVGGAPGVFDPKARPWINPDGASADRLAAVIDRCPTGALTYERKDGVAEMPDTAATFTLVADGPVHARGDFKLKRPDGTFQSQIRVALCRCGKSQNKPFCDNSHIEAGFKHDGTLGPNSVRPGEETGATPVGLRTRPDGPVVIEGPCQIRSADGSDVHSGTQAALCRCGGSSRKPYCDGSHKRNGFKGD